MKRHDPHLIFYMLLLVNTEFVGMQTSPQFHFPDQPVYIINAGALMYPVIFNLLRLKTWMYLSLVTPLTYYLILAKICKNQ